MGQFWLFDVKVQRKYNLISSFSFVFSGDISQPLVFDIVRIFDRDFRKLIQVENEVNQQRILIVSQRRYDPCRRDDQSPKIGKVAPEAELRVASDRKSVV